MRDKILELIMAGELELAEKLSKAAGFSIDKELHATAITGYPLFSVSYIALPLDRVGVRVQFEIDGTTKRYVPAKRPLNYWKELSIMHFSRDKYPPYAYPNVIKENGGYYCFEDFFSKYRALKFMLKIKEHERAKEETVKLVKFLQPSK